MHEAAGGRLRRHADSIALALLVAGSSVAVLSVRRFGLILNDEGWLLHPVLRMLEGEILYRDVWIHYAPIRYHALAALFSVTGPSMLVERTFLAVLIVASAAGLYCVARRFSPVWLAWLPGAVYALAPGPWHKAPYALCSVAWLLVLVRAMERSDRSRLFALGSVLGLTLGTRHDLGLLQLVLTLAIVVVFPALGGSGPTRRRRALAWVGLGAALPLLPLVAWYGAHSALAPLADALFVRAFAQAAGSSTEPLLTLLSPASFGTMKEGGRAGLLLLVSLLVYAVFGIYWVIQLARHGLTARSVLGGALLAVAVATLPQAYMPPMVVRFLQSATPCYLLATWLVAECVRAAGTRTAALAGGVVAAAAAGTVVWLAVIGVPGVAPSGDYAGSWRLRFNTVPVRVLGDEIFTSRLNAEEIHRVRGFLTEHARPDEPIFVWPRLSLYYIVLERSNPTRAVFERILPGDHAMTGAMKRAEMDRLLESRTRYALVSRGWWLRPAQDEVALALKRAFAPVRDFGRVIVLKRRQPTTAPAVAP